MTARNQYIMAKKTTEQEVRDLLASGHNATTLATKFNVCRATIKYYLESIGIKNKDVKAIKREVLVEQLKQHFASGLNLFQAMKRFHMGNLAIVAIIDEHNIPRYKVPGRGPRATPRRPRKMPITSQPSLPVEAIALGLSPADITPIAKYSFLQGPRAACKKLSLPLPTIVALIEFDKLQGEYEFLTQAKAIYLKECTRAEAKEIDRGAEATCSE